MLQISYPVRLPDTIRLLLFAGTYEPELTNNLD